MEIERGSKSGDLQKTIDFEVKEQRCRGQRVLTRDVGNVINDTVGVREEEERETKRGCIDEAQK